MSVRQIVRAAILGALELVIFTAFSQILYLEAVTFTIVCTALCLDRRTAILSSVCFCVLDMLLIQGITPWSAMYLVIYPVYSLAVSHLNARKITRMKAALITGILSCLTGQLLQIPWVLFSKKLAAGYFLIGLQTSLVQGILSGILAWVLYVPMCHLLKRLAAES